MFYGDSTTVAVAWHLRGLRPIYWPARGACMPAEVPRACLVAATEISLAAATHYHRTAYKAPRGGYTTARHQPAHLTLAPCNTYMAYENNGDASRRLGCLCGMPRRSALLSYHRTVHPHLAAPATSRRLISMTFTSFTVAQKIWELTSPLPLR